jgi:hypothetical protein
VIQQHIRMNEGAAKILKRAVVLQGIVGAANLHDAGRWQASQKRHARCAQADTGWSPQLWVSLLGTWQGR